MKTRLVILSLYLSLSSTAVLAAASLTPQGAWLLTTKTQVSLLPKAGGNLIKSQEVAGREFAQFANDRTYFASEWLNRFRLYFNDSGQYLITLDAAGQWTLKGTTYTVTYDTQLLGFKNKAGRSLNEPFLLRTNYKQTLSQALNITPVIDSIRLISYQDNGKLLKKGQSLKGQKESIWLVDWHDLAITPVKPEQAIIAVTQNYEGVPFTLTSTCCGSDAVQNATDSETFLTAIDGIQGVLKTESGLRYLVLQEGFGASPAATDTVTVNYRGFLPSGAIFDSNSLLSFSLSGVIKGWTEGLQLMKPGAKYRFFIPSALGYGSKGSQSGNIPGNAALVFDVELVSFGRTN